MACLWEHGGLAHDTDMSDFKFKDNSIFDHGMICFHFTTYDVQRDKDTVQPYSYQDQMNTQANREFVLVSLDDPGTENPFGYACVLRIFHAEVIHSCLSKPIQIEFLWVGWLQPFDSGQVESPHRLDHLQFIPGYLQEAIGFLDPSTVIRGAHLIPAFHHGQTRDLLASSKLACDQDGDWWFYYSMMFEYSICFSLSHCSLDYSFTDHDLRMHHLGLGVGHARGTHALPKPLPPLPVIADVTEAGGPAPPLANNTIGGQLRDHANHCKDGDPEASEYSEHDTGSEFEDNEAMAPPDSNNNGYEDL